jgi:hypothetical protein
MEERKQAKEALSPNDGRNVSLLMRKVAWLLISLLNGKGLMEESVLSLRRSENHPLMKEVYTRNVYLIVTISSLY